MKMILGFAAGCCAEAGVPADRTATESPSKPSNKLRPSFTVFLLHLYIDVKAQTDSAMGVTEQQAALKTTYRGGHALFRIPRFATPLMVGSIR